MFSEAKNFLAHGIWHLQRRRLNWKESIFIRLLRIFSLSLREFKRNQCQRRASALTFYTLLSLVPMLAMAIGIAKGFGLEAILIDKLLAISNQEMVMTKMVEYARTLLQSSQGEVIAGIGIVFLLWTILKALENIEHSFNDIWGIEHPRSLTRKFTDYFSLMFVCPLLFVLASSATVFFTGQIQNLNASHTWVNFLNPVFMGLLLFLPYVLLWALFTFLYIFMPNTHVRFSAALTGGMIAGTLYQIVQFVYIHFQIGVAQFNSIYGGFAAFPLFLIWIQTSWLIVFYGAEISFACQNETAYELELESAQASHRLKMVVALMLVAHSVKRFQELKEPPTVSSFLFELGLPLRLLNEVLDLLIRAKLLSMVKTPSEENAYQPGRPMENMTLAAIVEALDTAGVQSIAKTESMEIDRHREMVERFWRGAEAIPENLNIKEMIAFQENRERFFSKSLPSLHKAL